MHDIYTMDNNFKHDIPKVVSVPMELYESLLGNYFIGYADALNFGEYTGAWARLYNPPYSNVNLYVNVWTVSDISESTYQADIWFNATPSGIPRDSMFVTPSNTTIQPPVKPTVKLQFASGVRTAPVGGSHAFVRIGEPGTTLADTENGKFIFPPDGSFLVFLSNPVSPAVKASGKVAFGWWEERIR